LGFCLAKIKRKARIFIYIMIYIINMAEIDVQVKKWGDSLAVVIPKGVVDQENIAVKDSVHLKVEKKVDISDIFGVAKNKAKFSIQQLKDEARKGWD